MKHLYDVKDNKGNRIRINLNEGIIKDTVNDKGYVIEQDDIQEIEKRIQGILERYIPKRLQEAKENGEIK